MIGWMTAGLDNVVGLQLSGNGSHTIALHGTQSQIVLISVNHSIMFNILDLQERMVTHLHHCHSSYCA